MDRLKNVKNICSGLRNTHINKKKYIFPKCKGYEEQIAKMEGLSRLFAFPNKPTLDNDLTILDSGAYNLYKNGGHIDKGYMVQLSKHYEKYWNKKVICVAPDVFLNPMQSMWNMRKWFQNNLFPHVAAVIQAERMKYIDLNMLKYQVDYYSNFTEIMFFSNNGLTGEMAKMFKLEELFKYMKETHKVKWIHILGAGWSLKDIKDWCTINYFDSLDSIAYYNCSDEEFGSTEPIENIKNIIKLMEEINNV